MNLWVCRCCGSVKGEAVPHGCRRCDGAELSLYPPSRSRECVLSFLRAADHLRSAAPRTDLVDYRIDLGARRRLLRKECRRSIEKLVEVFSCEGNEDLARRLETMPVDHLEWMDEIESVMRELADRISVRGKGHANDV